MHLTSAAALFDPTDIDRPSDRKGSDHLDRSKASTSCFDLQYEWCSCCWRGWLSSERTNSKPLPRPSWRSLLRPSSSISGRARVASLYSIRAADSVSEQLAVYGYPGQREFRPEYGLFTHVTPISGQRTISRMPMTQPRPNVLTVWKNPVVR